MSSESSSDTSKDDKKEKFTEKEIKELLGTTISSGYTNEEIENIIAGAEPVYASSTVDFSNVRPKHTNTRNYVVDLETGKLVHPECYFEVNGQPLRLKTEFNVTPDTEIDETRLFSGFDTTDKSAVKHLYFKGNAGYTIECTLLVRADDLYIGDQVGNINYDSDTTVASVLMDWERMFQSCIVITDSPIVQKGYYRLKIEQITQVNHNLIEFDVRFIQDTYHYNTDLQTYGAMSKMINVLRVGGSNSGYYSSGELDKTDLSDVKPIEKEAIKINTNNTNKVKDTSLINQLKSCNTIRKLCKCTTFKRKNCNTTYMRCTYYYQSALKKLGYYLDGKHDGLFCYYTHQATIKFQRDKKLVVDGIVGKQTMGKIIELLEKL